VGSYIVPHRGPPWLNRRGGSLIYLASRGPFDRLGFGSRAKRLTLAIHDSEMFSDIPASELSQQLH